MKTCFSPACTSAARALSLNAQNLNTQNTHKAAFNASNVLLVVCVILIISIIL